MHGHVLSRVSRTSRRAIRRSCRILPQHGVQFPSKHFSQEQRYIVVIHDGGVDALKRGDGDGWLDISLTNAPSVSMALQEKKPKESCFAKIQTGRLPTGDTDQTGWAIHVLGHGGAVAEVTNADGL